MLLKARKLNNYWILYLIMLEDAIHSLKLIPTIMMPYSVLYCDVKYLLFLNVIKATSTCIPRKLFPSFYCFYFWVFFGYLLRCCLAESLFVCMQFGMLLFLCECGNYYADSVRQTTLPSMLQLICTYFRTLRNIPWPSVRPKLLLVCAYYLERLAYDELIVVIVI